MFNDKPSSDVLAGGKRVSYQSRISNIQKSLTTSALGGRWKRRIQIEKRPKKFKLS